MPEQGTHIVASGALSGRARVIHLALALIMVSWDTASASYLARAGVALNARLNL